MIITIFIALVLSADVTPENNFYTRFYIDVSSFETLKSSLIFEKVREFLRIFRK